MLDVFKAHISEYGMMYEAAVWEWTFLITQALFQ